MLVQQGSLWDRLTRDAISISTMSRQIVFWKRNIVKMLFCRLQRIPHNQVAFIAMTQLVFDRIKGQAKFTGQCNLKIEVTKSPCQVYNSREKCVSPIQRINEKKTTDPIQKFYGSH